MIYSFRKSFFFVIARYDKGKFDRTGHGLYKFNDCLLNSLKGFAIYPIIDSYFDLVTHGFGTILGLSYFKTSGNLKLSGNLIPYSIFCLWARFKILLSTWRLCDLKRYDVCKYLPVKNSRCLLP